MTNPTPTPARRQRRLLTPLTYKIGEDVTPEKYQEILLAVTDWFAQSRNTDEPGARARKALQACLDGTKSDGQPWFAAANASFAARVRAMCRYDIEAMRPLVNASDKQREKKRKEKDREDRRRKEARQDKFIPAELTEEQRKLGAKNVKYGDDPSVLLSTKELQYWRELYTGYVQQFPELVAISAQSELKQLCDIQTLAERYRLKMLAGERVDIKDRASVGQDIERLKKALGIHPDQLAKRSQDKIETSIGAVAAKLDVEQWRLMRARFWLEEMLQIFQMYMQPRADGLGYQLDEVGLFGMTKCRTCICPSCGQRNYVGIKIQEIERKLREEGVLELIEPEAPAEPPDAVAE